jgi:hypothetical protein
MHTTIETLRRAGSQEECLRMAYDILTAKYYGDRLKTVLRFPELFPSSPEALWQRSGFLHCTNFNRLLKILLVQSSHFAATDIRFRWTLIWYVSPHQYVRVRMNDGHIIPIDAWANRYGIQFGDYTHGFHTRSSDRNAP